MASMTTVTCGNKKCRKEFQARTADVKRGWGRFCSKSCKAKKQTRDTGISGPDYRATGRAVNEMKHGKYTKSKFNGGVAPWDAAGVSKDTYLHYAREYGGIPLFSRRGDYEGFIPGPFDNSTDRQNSEPFK